MAFLKSLQIPPHKAGFFMVWAFEKVAQADLMHFLKCSVDAAKAHNRVRNNTNKA
jgi:hypothetical protein